MRISVVGGAGFTGIHLVPALLDRGHDVQVYDNLFSRRRREELTWLGDVRFAEGDITDGDVLRTELLGFAPEIIFHLAALHYIPYCDLHPEQALRVNVEGTLHLMLAARQVRSLKAVLFASSVAVYPALDHPHRETDPPGPSDIYGLTKWLGEHVVEQYARQAHFSHLALRFSNLYGPGETNPHVIPVVIEQLLNGAGTLRLGRTDPCRDFLYVGDLVEALMATIPVVTETETHSILNIGAGQEWPVQEAVDILCQLSGRNIQVVRDASRVRAADRPHLRAHIERARQLLCWEPKHDLRAGLEKTFAREYARHSHRSASASHA
jgi:UDP-glucose 4-epimerase